MRSEVCDLLNIQYPIFQGAMARISESNLVAAVSNAGGLGILAGGTTPPDIIREEIKKIKKLTDKPFAVNIMLLADNCEALVDIICEENVPIVTTGAGSPAKYIEKFKEHNVKVIPVVPSVAIAKKMEQLGVDAVIAEGMEAGGHVGKTTTMALIPQIVDAVDIPVICAGGIADGRGAVAGFALGAKGIQVGTRFLVAKECIIHEDYKKKVLKARDIDTVLTGQITGHPVRVLKNKLAKLYDKVEKEEMIKEKPDLERVHKLGMGALEKAVVHGDIKEGSLMAGQIAGMVTKEQSVKEIIDEIVKEFSEVKTNI